MTEQPTIHAFKGFDANMQCRGFQFEVGKTYTHDGKVEACKSGFHAIEGHPLEVLSYYPPAGSRFAVVELSGAMARHSDDSKVAAEILTVTREISLSDLATEAVKWVMDRATGKGPIATGKNGLATASGTRGAATASGTQGAATASGTRGAATASGDQGAATASGTQGAAMACGYMGKAKGANGNALFLVERARWDGPIVSVCAVIVGQDGIAPETWYRCEGGKAVLA